MAQTSEEIDFLYTDTDTYQAEISEIYSFGEESDFLANRNAFEESMEDSGLPLAWCHMVKEQKSKAINYLLTNLEVSSRSMRIKSCRALAYLIQGNFGECQAMEEQERNSQENVFCLYEHGIFQAFVQQLHIESNLSRTQAPHKPCMLLEERVKLSEKSSELRVILSVLCTITETIYHAKDSTDPKRQSIRQQFIEELQMPIGDEILAITLFQMLNVFCCGQAAHYPIRKMCLLLWKVLLITLGGSETAAQIKEAQRQAYKLDSVPDDTLNVIKHMRPCSPPGEPDAQGANRQGNWRMALLVNKRKVLKQRAFDEALDAYSKKYPLNALGENSQADVDNVAPEFNGEFASEENIDGPETVGPVNNLDDYVFDGSVNKEDPESLTDSGLTSDAESPTSDKLPADAPDEVESEGIRDHMDDIVTEPCKSGQSDLDMSDMQPPTVSRSLKLSAMEQQPGDKSSDPALSAKGLPWATKVRKEDLKQHLTSIREKFLGYTLPNDLETTFGLPGPIIEGIQVLRKHLYVSLAEAQLEREDLMDKYPLIHREINSNFADSPAEKLYVALLPRLPQYMISLLKILLAANPVLKNKSDKTDSMNITSELVPNIGSSMLRMVKDLADEARQEEIIIKAISAILILLLKHFKVNHINQFEYVSQQLMFANCIPLILKFLSHDVSEFVTLDKRRTLAFEFPACVVGELPEQTLDATQLYSDHLHTLRPSKNYCWRNMFSCINLVRILNKLTKWKHSRIMMLVVFKSAPTLLKTLNVRQPMFQLYVLKLLKVQLKFLGRQWKKNNMRLISAIYQKVRHRITDDWAYSNENEARPWDFQGEEFGLQAHINRFHQRRYPDLIAPARNNASFQPNDKFLFEEDPDEGYDVGTCEVFSEISSNFDYKNWLEEEVFRRNIDWDKLLSS